MRLCAVSMEPHYALLSSVATHTFLARELGLPERRSKIDKKIIIVQINTKKKEPNHVFSFLFA